MNDKIITVDEDERFLYKECHKDGLVFRWAEAKEEADPVLKYLAPLCDSIIHLKDSQK
jgi:hypothetical protein